MDENDDVSDDESDNKNVAEDTQHTAKSGWQWTQIMPRRNERRAPTRNVIRGKPGVSPGIQPVTPKEAFLLFFENIIDDVVRFTNLEARRVVAIYNRTSRLRKMRRPTTRDEIGVFIGLSILAGVLRSHHLNTLSLWSE